MTDSKSSNERLSDPPVAFVTQEMWDTAQAALMAVLPLVETNVPPLSTQGTAIALRDLIKKAIRGDTSEIERLRKENRELKAVVSSEAKLNCEMGEELRQRHETLSQPRPYTHVKTGNKYEVLHDATETTNGSREGRGVVVYRRIGQTAVYVREASEFHEKFVSTGPAQETSAPIPDCECLIRDKTPSAYHAVKCPRFTPDVL
jgi:hypothetical protein